jgi:4'-phosphopantetheinyl transferase
VSRDVDVWPIELDTGLAPAVSPLLSPAERERCSRLQFDRDRQRFTVATGATRLILAHYTGVPAADLTFARSPHGKPSIVWSGGQSPVRFNLTHSYDRALLAVAYRHEVGVDLERKNEDTDVESLARRYFCPSEYLTLEALSPAARRDAFFRLWTLKEAVMKAVGLGLSLPPDQIEVTLTSAGPSALLRLGDEGMDRWCVCELPAVHGYVAALAVEGFGWQSRWRSCTEVRHWPK